MTFEEAQKTLTEYADSLEEMKVYIHRDLKTLPKEYVETVNSYLSEGVRNIKLREQIEEFELNYEKARGELFDCVHERDKIKAELDQFTLDVDKELEKLEAIETLMREQPWIQIGRGILVDGKDDQYTVQQAYTSHGQALVYGILAVLFPDEEAEE